MARRRTEGAAGRATEWPELELAVTPPFAPMEARLTSELPVGDDWWFEPKWDGFRCLAFRDGDRVVLQSKAQRPLGRYFPEVVKALRSVRARRFVLDGELVVPVDGSIDFDRLLQRIHPAASRVERLAEETPAIFIAFDLLARGTSDAVHERPLAERRGRLEAFALRHLAGVPRTRISPVTEDRAVATSWLGMSGVDGVVAKDPTAPYLGGSREGMRKVKRMRTADCVVGGFRYAAHGGGVGSLLLGLYGEDGLLHHVGFTSAFAQEQRVALARELEPLIEPPGFTGSGPGGPSRWTAERERREWQPLRPERVVEVTYDHFTGGRFRHGTTVHRWRPDKAPEQCAFDQLEPEGTGALEILGREPVITGPEESGRRRPGRGGEAA